MLLNQLRHKKGSLLLEALLATAILSISIVVIIQSLSVSARATSYNINYTKALMFLDNKFFDALRDPNQKLSSLDEGAFPFPDDHFHYRQETSDPKEESMDNLQDLHLNVSWNLDNKNQQLQLETYRFFRPRQ